MKNSHKAFFLPQIFVFKKDKLLLRHFVRFAVLGGEKLRAFIKFLCCICSVICITVFALMFFVEYTIPESIITIDKISYNVPKIFGLPLLNVNVKSDLNVAKGNDESIPQEAEIDFLNIIPIKNIQITNSKRKYVVVGGDIFGIKLYTDGVIVVDTDVVETKSGKINPAENAGIVIGDVIKEIDGVQVKSTKHLVELFEKSQGEKIKLKIFRDGEEKNLIFKTYMDTVIGKYKAGLWVRDSTAGLGTVTFYNQDNNSFAGLGHPIYDIDTQKILPMKYGEMAEATIKGLYKSSNGSVGELCGVLSGKDKGNLCINDETGVYGFVFSKIKGDSVPLAVKQEISLGDAQITCTVDNSGPQYFDIKIIKIYSNSQSVNKDMIIKITDEELLSKTGGIVQGMSGSPIIQNGMLVGAVTHVFVNDPTQGYAIFAERMLETSECREMQKYEQLQNAS